MKIRHCLIVDDSVPVVILLKSYLQRIPFFHQVSSCGSASEAIEILNNQQIDLLLLDIELSDFSGISLLRGTPLELLPPTIIISSHGEYAVDSYEIGKAVDFIKKPFDFDRFLLGVNRALAIGLSKTSFSDKDSILLKKGRQLQRFDFCDLNFIEAYGIYTKIHSSKGIEVVNENISSLESKLDAKQFVRIHKSFIVNIDRITNIDNKQFWINNISVPVGRHYKSQFDAIYQLFDKNIE